MNPPRDLFIYILIYNTKTFDHVIQKLATISEILLAGKQVID